MRVRCAFAWAASLAVGIVLLVLTHEAHARGREGLPPARTPAAHAAHHRSSAHAGTHRRERNASRHRKRRVDWAACRRRGAHRLSGRASIYRGGRTANGERARRSSLTAAHCSLPFGTRVRVTNRRNGRSIVVRINDRGPYVRGRVIDLTPAGARALRFSGLAAVSLAVVRANSRSPRRLPAARASSPAPSRRDGPERAHRPGRTASR